MRAAIIAVSLSIATTFLATATARAQEERKAHSAAHENQRFENPDLNIKEYITRFESDSREISARRREIVEALGLRPGMAIADVGAGTGLFTWMFAEKVGAGGTVYAVEIAPAFLKYLGDEARKRSLGSVVKPVRGSQEATNLAPGSIDVAFVCATYHHFEHPEKVLASIHRALRPGGRLVVIDFDLRKDSSDFVREHARAAKEVYFREIRAAGFAPVEPQPQLPLKENFLAIFRRTEPEARSTAVPNER